MSLNNTNYGVEILSDIFKKVRKAYFLGIGGINVSSLALMTKSKGVEVSGYDRTRSDITDRLSDSGIKVYYELDPHHVDGADIVIYTLAIQEDNPEYLRACELGIKTVSRADYMGFLMSSYKNRIGVCGMHGKSTTTAMISTIFESAGKDPTVLLGAESTETGSSYGDGREVAGYREGGISDLIFEACEYKDSFLDFFPTVATVLNIDLDHLDYFKGIEHIRSSFLKFVSKCPEFGTAVMNYDDENVRMVADQFNGKTVSFGINCSDADFRAENIVHQDRRSSFDITSGGKILCRITLPVIGDHFVKNALAAAVTSRTCGLDWDEISKGLQSYRGVRRRLEFKGKFHGADLFDDYAHHPCEVKSSLSALNLMGYDRVWCVFQPHTFSRTKKLFDEFVSVFSDSGACALFTDIYPARERYEDWKITSSDLSEAVSGSRYFPVDEDIIGFLKDNVSEKDAVIIMGAGNVDRLFSIIDYTA